LKRLNPLKRLILAALVAALAVAAALLPSSSGASTACTTTLNSGATLDSIEAYTAANAGSATVVCLTTGLYGPSTTGNAVLKVGRNVTLEAKPADQMSNTTQYVTINGRVQLTAAGGGQAAAEVLLAPGTALSGASTAYADGGLAVNATFQAYYNNSSVLNTPLAQRYVSGCGTTGHPDCTDAVPSAWATNVGSSTWTTDPTSSDRRIHAVDPAKTPIHYTIDSACGTGDGPSSSTYHFIASTDDLPYLAPSMDDDGNGVLDDWTHPSTQSGSDKTNVFLTGNDQAHWNTQSGTGFGRAYSFWKVSTFPYSGIGITACSGTRWKIDSNEDGIVDTGGKGDRESGIPFLSSTIRGVEAEYGINHPLGLDVGGSAAPSNYISPATKSNPESNTGTIPYGALLRLKDNVTAPCENDSTCSQGQVNIMAAARKYGAYVVDDGNGSTSALNVSRRGTSDAGLGVAKGDLGYWIDAVGRLNPLADQSNHASDYYKDNTIAAIEALGLDISKFEVVCTPELDAANLVSGC
jgi:hypothetical protein